MWEGNIPVCSPVIKQKSDYFALQLQVVDFKCSNGWLQRFEQWNNLIYKTVCGERAAVDKDAAVRWQHNAQTTVICKLKNLRCFQGINYIRLPCDYQTNENAWVMSTVFQSWLVAFDKKMATLNGNVLLILDCYATHTAHGLQLNNVTLMFLPANTTNIMQSLDQGIIHTVKRLYRSRLVKYLIHQLEQQKCSQPKWNVLDAMRNIIMAWDSVSADTIQNCFAKSGFGQTCGGGEEESLDLGEGWEELKQHGASGDTEEYAHIDVAVPKAAPLTDHDRAGKYHSSYN
ncbi:hypothetical protein PR048_006517, partial [Dryococelus australis]